MEKVGIIAFAFGQQGGNVPSAGPSNEVISIIAVGISGLEVRRGNVPLISGQWETVLPLRGRQADFVVSEFGTDTHYIDTKPVLDNSLKFFREQGAKRVILIAHPLHLFFIMLLIKTGVWKTDGFTIDTRYNKRFKIIPYDRSEGNIQWWTRNPFAFIYYLGKTFFTRKHGN